VAAGTLALLAAAVAGRVRLERLDPGWARLDGLAFVGLVRALHAQGLDLAAAAAAASGWCRGAEAEAAKQVGRDLAAGADALQGGRLLDSFEAGLLAAAAREGVAAAALDALWLSRQHVAQREIPGAVARVEFLALAIAGCGVLAMAVGFALAYGRALVGA
jgi:hypothetical protein